MKDTLQVPIAPGELLDKISILEIKAEQIDNPTALANVRHELELLTNLWQSTGLENTEVASLRNTLKTINKKLWQIEDDIRDCEREQNFSDHFIELARAVYKTNDHRAETKKAINLLLGSQIVEEKSYKKY